MPLNLSPDKVSLGVVVWIPSARALQEAHVSCLALCLHTRSTRATGVGWAGGWLLAAGCCSQQLLVLVASCISGTVGQQLCLLASTWVELLSADNWWCWLEFPCPACCSMQHDQWWAGAYWVAQLVQSLGAGWTPGWMEGQTSLGESERDPGLTGALSGNLCMHSMKRRRR
jgi:hypothetical protein